MVRGEGIPAPSRRVGRYARRQEEVSGVSGLGGGGRTGPQGDAVRPDVARLGHGFERFQDCRGAKAASSCGGPGAGRPRRAAGAGGVTTKAARPVAPESEAEAERALPRSQDDGLEGGSRCGHEGKNDGHQSLAGGAIAHGQLARGQPPGGGLTTQEYNLQNMTLLWGILSSGG